MCFILNSLTFCFKLDASTSAVSRQKILQVQHCIINFSDNWQLKKHISFQTTTRSPHKQKARTHKELGMDSTNNFSKSEVIEITRRLHKIKRRLLLNAANRHDSSASGDDGNQMKSVYTKSTCACHHCHEGSLIPSPIPSTIEIYKGRE